MRLTRSIDYLRALLVTRARVTDAARMVLPPGLWHERHTVPDAKLILVLSGSLRYTVDDLTVRLMAGSILYRPAATPAEWLTGADSSCELAYVEFAVDAMRDTFGQPVWVTHCDMALEQASFSRLRELQFRSGEASALESEGELKALVARFFRRATVPDTSAPTDVGTLPRSTGNTAEVAVRAAQAWLNENLAKPDVLNGLADRVGLSDDHFRLVFRRFSGMSARAYLTRIRMMAARSYLERSSLSVKEIARRVGYDDALYFSRHYRKVTGRSPTEERARVAIK